MLIDKSVLKHNKYDFDTGKLVARIAIYQQHSTNIYVQNINVYKYKAKTRVHVRVRYLKGLGASVC